MKLGLQIPSFTWDGGPERIGETLRDIARRAEAVGYDSVWVMDHFFQIPVVGRPQEPMLEGYTALSHMAAVTSRVGLGALVTGVTYRHPGILAKTVTTLDVLSGGRAWLGIGAAWNEHEHRGLGVPFPPVAERFERLEDAVRICLQMWSDDDGPFDGRHARLDETLNSPQALSRPHPPILIGGGGELKTLRLVARYADACNVFGDPATARRKFEVLRRHCEREGRDEDEILKTVYYPMDVGEGGDRVAEVLEDLASLAEAGVQGVIGRLRAVEEPGTLELVGERVIAEALSL
jgi:F420-dependent oxidoreductase-like protein